MMSFLNPVTQISHTINIIYIFKLKFTLQAYKHIAYIVLLKNSHCSKRTSSCFQQKVKAAVTVEAAIAIPVFLFFLINILGIINVFLTYSDSLATLQQSAKAVAYMSCDISDAGEDLVTFRNVVPIKPIIGEIAFKPSNSIVAVAYKKWNGYSNSQFFEDANEEEYVYITAGGYAYHKNRNCKHLTVSVEVITKAELVSKRNNSGSRYKACEKCKANGTGMLFITREGDKYHSSASCSGLKRTVRVVKLSEVEGRSCCSECGR